VRAATRDPAAARLPAGAQAVAWAYDEPSTWGPALAGVQALYLAMPPFRSDEVELGRAILAAARAAGVQRVVKLSAAGVENDPESGHRQVELLIEGSGLSWVHLRPTFFHENFIEFYGHGIREQGLIALPAGEGRTGFIAAEDIGRAAAEALLGSHSGEAWTLTGPQSLTHDDVASALSAALGRPIRYQNISPEEHIAGMRAWQAPELAVQTMSALYGFVRAGWTGGLSGDLERVTGSRGLSLSDWAGHHRSAWD
jgi:uncharacterized protein YbjT (DUF2867 family)